VIVACIICTAPNIDATGDGVRRFGDRLRHIDGDDNIRKIKQ
jgi:hypothetical protein